MNTNLKRFGLSSLAMAVLSGLTGAQAIAKENNSTQESDEAIEEVVVKVSRLKGSATAVIEERKNQAFVADILGADQIARTGDGDAAGALRRVTGLTLVDGKFIYVRGLGERYSSTQLNGSSVPSPDPTRTVIPLDLFPSSIIESLSVQKSYSPSMPAHFGGGNVDIRLRSIPTEFVFNLSGNMGWNTNHSDGLTYEGGDTDWYGIDDGTRQAPAALRDLWSKYNPLADLSQQENRVIAADLYKNYDPKAEYVGPDLGLGMTIGNRFNTDNFRYGFLTAISYDNEWMVSEEYEGQDYTLQPDGSYKMVRGFDQVDSTEHSVRWSGMFNFGVEYKRDHKIDFSSTLLHDTRDQIKDKLGNTNNVLITDGLRIRDSEVTYEERELMVNQLRGSHTLPEYWFIGFDWSYSDSRSNRYAPGNISTRYILSDENADGLFDIENESSLRNATTASRYTFQDLDDRVEDVGWNLSLPLTFARTEVELKTGAKFIEKRRDAFGRRIDVNTLAFDSLDLTGYQMDTILNDDVVLNHPLSGSELLIRDTSVAGDDYSSGQKVDGYYFEADVFFDDKWRLSGGVRWEDFRQVVAPIDPATGQFDIPAEPTEEDLEALAFKEDDWYGALALTYIIDDEMQFRASYGETAIRPDIREVAPATYIDPLTEFPIGGTPGVRSTQIKNYDVRWEWYFASGDNLSVGLFYKDMIDPIESVQSPAQDGPPLIRIANAEDGEVYGVEAEFMKDFSFLGDFMRGIGNDFFLSGNVTISDSEINIDTQKVVEQTGVSTAITNTSRRMTGHSQYVVNFNLGYDHPNGNHTATLAYNVFGERIIIPGIDGKDDAYEQPFHSLDFVYTYFPTYSSTLRFRLQNILNQEKEITFDDTLLRSETRGITFGVNYRQDF